MYVGMTTKTPKDQIEKFNLAYMLMKGDDRQENESLRLDIRKATGVYSIFGKNKMEISDKESLIRKDIAYLNGRLFKSDMPLKSLLKHKELYKIYPELKKIPVSMTYNSNSSTMASAGHHQIVINLANINSKEELRSTLLHEIQHLIQDVHGWDAGSNMKSNMLTEDREEMIKELLSFQYGDEEKSAIYDNYERLVKETPNINKLDLFAKGVPKDCAEYLSKLHAYTSSSDSQAFSIYQRYLGEIEARSTQARIDMSMDERLLTHPYASEGQDFEKINPIYLRWNNGEKIHVRQNTLDEIYEGYLIRANEKKSAIDSLPVEQDYQNAVIHYQEQEHASEDMYSSFSHNINESAHKENEDRQNKKEPHSHDYGISP